MALLLYTKLAPHAKERHQTSPRTDLVAKEMRGSIGRKGVYFRRTEDDGVEEC